MKFRDIAIFGACACLAGIAGVFYYYDFDIWDYLALIRHRLFVLGCFCVGGYLAGAALSPKFSFLRKYLLVGAAVLFVLFGLLVPTDVAESFGYLINIGSFAALFTIGVKLGQIVRKAAPRAIPTSYGSAKWATFDYLAGNGLFAERGFLLGKFQDGTRSATLRYAGARHMLTVAPTRSGKGVSSIIPNLLLHHGSALVIDPKGENALITAHRRGKGGAARGNVGLGQRIILLDPWDVAASTLGMEQAKFNPLDWIKAGDPDAAENAFILADALVVKDGGSDAAFWDEEAKSLLTGIIMYVATAVEENGNRHLGRVREILTLPPDDFEDVLRIMYKHPDPLVASTAARTASKEEKLVSGVLATAQSHTHFLESPRIRESLLASDFSFEELKSGLVTVYLILPADRLHTFNRWLRMLIQQAITVNARNIDVKPKTPILFMLDEMPTLGKLPSIEQAYGLMAGFGMQLWGIVQDLSQLAKIYGEHGWQTFISNSGVIQYFGSRDQMTAEYFSKLCGVTTIEVHNLSWAVGRMLGTSSSSSSGPGGTTHTSGSSSSSSWTRTNGVSEAQRHLAYPDELMVLRNTEEIVFVENLDPIVAQKTPWYADPTMKQLGADLQKTDKALIKDIDSQAALSIQTASA